jgi:hypothetical protein
MSYDITDNICQDLQNWRYCFYQRRQNLFVITLTDNFQNQSVLAHESYQQSYIFFLWIKVSLVIQTLSAVHIKRKMSNLPRIIVIIIHVPVEEKRVL